MISGPRLRRILLNLVSYREWRYQIRFRFWGLFQRAWRGWADIDVWNFDGYLDRVIAGGLRHLADNHDGVPQTFLARTGQVWTDERGYVGGDVQLADELWTAWLRSKANWFELASTGFDPIGNGDSWIEPGLSEEEVKLRVNRYHAKVSEFHGKELPDFVKYWADLWN